MIILTWEDDEDDEEDASLLSTFYYFITKCEIATHTLEIFYPQVHMCIMWTTFSLLCTYAFVSLQKIYVCLHYNMKRINFIYMESSYTICIKNFVWFVGDVGGGGSVASEIESCMPPPQEIILFVVGIF